MHMDRDLYFSERETGTKPRVVENITHEVWQGIVAAIQRRINDGSFGNKYPLQCASCYWV